MPSIEKLNAAIDAFAEQGYGSQGGVSTGELGRQRALALDAYQGKNIEPAPKGRSQVIDWTVFETVQWILPSLTRIFAGGDDVVEFEPVGPEDEEGSKQESEVLNHMVVRKDSWFLTCLEWFTDALITKNAYCMAFMEEKLTPEVETYEGQTEEQLALLLEDGDVEIVGQRQYDDPDDEGVIIDPFTGQPAPDEETALGAAAVYESQGVEPQMARKQLFDVQIRKVIPTKRLRFQVLPPERCITDINTPDFTLEDCNYFEYWEDMPISDLRKMGYDVPDDIGANNDDYPTREDTARDDQLELDTAAFDDYPDPAMKQVQVRTIWVRYDYDEDGIAELQKVVRVGKEILDYEPANRIPVASIVPFINTHRHMGMSVADLVFDIQRIKTAMLRQGIDSLYLSNNPRHAVSEMVNLDDLLVSRPGGVVRLKNGAIPGEGHILPLQTENTFPFAQQGLEHMDRVVESRVGVNRIFQGIDESALNDHNRIGQLSTMAAQRVEQIARIFGHGITNLFSIAHELLIKSGHKQKSIRLRGQWVDIDPTSWRTGRDMRIVAPYAAGNKDSLVQRLMVIAQIHEKALAGGLPIVTADDAYELALELSSAADLNGSKFFTDPATIPPPEPQPDYTAIALEIENKKADAEAADEERQNELERFKIETQADLDKYKADLNAELQIQLKRMDEGKALSVEKLRAMINNPDVDVSNIDFGNSQTEALMDAISALNRPRRVVRDEQGRVVGTEPA